MDKNKMNGQDVFNVFIVMFLFLISVYSICTYHRAIEIKEKVVNIENEIKANNVENELYLCPHCNSKLTVFSSSGVIASVAQLRCDACGFRTPEVSIDRPDAKLECIKKCKENFKNNNWSEE